MVKYVALCALACLLGAAMAVHIDRKVHTCGHPGTPRDGMMHAGRAGTITDTGGVEYKVGARVSFSCKDEKWHKLEGASSITCEKDGMWSDVVPHCAPLYDTAKDNSPVQHRCRTPIYFSCSSCDRFVWNSTCRYGRDGESGMKDDTWWAQQMRGYDEHKKHGHLDHQGLNGASGINFVEAEIH